MNEGVVFWYSIMLVIIIIPAIYLFGEILIEAWTDMIQSIVDKFKGG